MAEPNILAVDATSEALSIAVLSKGKVSHVRRNARAHDEALPGAIDAALSRARVGFKDLDAVAAASGPGRFTGIRIGMSFAAVAAHELKIPAIAVSRLEALAFSSQPGRVCAVIKGWRDERYHQRFARSGEDALPLAEGEAAWTPAEAWPAERARLESEGWRVEETSVDARALALLAAKRLQAKRLPKFAPFYLKPAGYELKVVR